MSPRLRKGYRPATPVAVNEVAEARCVAVVARALWQADAAMSVVCGLAIPYFMFTRQKHSMEKLTAVWPPPIVASEVAAASGGLLAPHLAAPEAFLTLILSYVLWACSAPLAMSVLVLLFLRLALHKLPERDMGVSAWLALGPIGTGALGLVVLGAAAPKIFAANGLASVGEVAFGFGVIGGLILWGNGIWWLSLAILKTVHDLREGCRSISADGASPSRSRSTRSPRLCSRASPGSACSASPAEDSRCVWRSSGSS